MVEKYTIEVSQSGKDVHTPIDGSKLGAFDENFNQDLDESIEILEQTFKQWKNYPAPKRGEMIRLFGNAVREAKDDLSKMNVLRRIISPMGTMDGIEFLIAKLKNTKNNADFFDSMNKSAN